MSKSRRLAYTALITNVIIWGAALPVVKPALEIITPYQFLFYRYLLAAPLCTPIIIYLLIKHKPTAKQLITILALEILGVTLALTFLYEGLKRTSSIETAIITNISPIFITVAGAIFLKEVIERHEKLGLTLAALGTGIVVTEPLIMGRTTLVDSSFTGNLITLGYPLLWGIYLLLAKKYYKSISKILIGLISTWVGLFSFFALVYINHTPSQLIEIVTPLSVPSVFIASAYMGILGSIIALTAYIYGNNLIEASEASLFTYLTPVVAIPLSVFFLNEVFTPLMALGLIFSITGVYIAEKRTKTNRSKNKK